MNEQQANLVAALHQSFADLGVPAPTFTQRDTSPAAFEDEDTLRRSHLSRGAARAQCRGGFLRVDEQGYDRAGRYYPQHDGASR